MKKRFDAVEFQRRARKRLSRLYTSSPEEFRKQLRPKCARREQRLQTTVKG